MALSQDMQENIGMCQDHFILQYHKHKLKTFLGVSLTAEVAKHC